MALNWFIQFLRVRKDYKMKILKMIVRIRSMDRDKRREEEEILDLYLSALGIE